ncbi:hypothetical protein FUAX_24510 [Fulvitalea axinellae]|uniref:Uncharacterized protein n=1 Tax=Fulvitalea axinellae TaxID=1182444 RepID=A0AAU9CD10_9BACT|nr:hypothetical protein FUAX_24510 [Fulvitalea axinellae]
MPVKIDSFSIITKIGAPTVAPESDRKSLTEADVEQIVMECMERVGELLREMEDKR